MISKLAILFISIHIQGLSSILQNHIEKAKQTHPDALPILISDHGPKPSIFAPTHSKNIQIIPPKATNIRKNKGINLPVAFQISHQFLVPTNLHVIPLHSSVHHHVASQDNTRISFITHTHAANITHQTQLVPILIPYPYHNQLVPVQDLSVIPLHRPNLAEHKAQFRSIMEKKENEDESVNRFRQFYGGFGTGLLFGGHGAGHGFYAYG